jgi:hypothetical protein
VEESRLSSLSFFRYGRASAEKQVSRVASSLLLPEVEFGVADNSTYPIKDF